MICPAANSVFMLDAVFNLCQLSFQIQPADAMCALKNKDEVAGWARRYQIALRRYLMQKDPAGLRAALKLGNQAVALGLDTLGLAMLHHKALASLVLPMDSVVTVAQSENQAKRFFAEMLIPVEKASSASLKTIARVHQVTEALRKCKAESKASARHLERNIAKRQKAEAALELSGKACLKLVEESNSLSALLHEETRKKLVMQEKQRKESSLHLQNVVAQSLVAIDLKLLALKISSELNAEKLSKELDDTERLVRKLHLS